jgi:hypothetical protein
MTPTGRPTISDHPPAEHTTTWELTMHRADRCQETRRRQAVKESNR